MTFRRDKFATLYGSRRTLLSTGDFFDWKGKPYRVTSHSRWYCGARRHYPPDPRLGRIVVDEYLASCKRQLRNMVSINREYAAAFKSAVPVRTVYRRGVSWSC